MLRLECYIDIIAQNNTILYLDYCNYIGIKNNTKLLLNKKSNRNVFFNKQSPY